VTATIVDSPARMERVSAHAPPGARLVIGRSKSADLVIDDPTVSDFHIELRGTEEGVILEDLGSHNGSYCGELRIRSATLATGGDLQLGQSLVRVASAGTPPGVGHDTSREAASAPPEAHVARTSERDQFGELRGTSQAARSLFEILAKLAPTDLSVLLDGPTGTGKDLAARGLHTESRRAGGPFQVLDCAAIPPTLAESVLFGHERGAFTGAEKTRPGVFEAATGGTVFLDEIGDLPLEVQPKLLRALEQRQVTRVGGRVAIAVDVRVIAASWKNLRRMVNDGRFREDLYHRIAQVRVVLPGLDERRADIPGLVLHFLRSLPKDVRGARTISREAMAELKKREYPGNVRELRNIVERAAQMAEGPVIAPSDLVFERMLERGLMASLAVDEGGDDLLKFKDAKQTAIDDFERLYLLRLRDRAEGSLRKATIIAGVQRHYLRSVFRKHGIVMTETDGRGEST
jgi:DNA-binding NtrC family response regulator